MYSILFSFSSVSAVCAIFFYCVSLAMVVVYDFDHFSHAVVSISAAARRYALNEGGNGMPTAIVMSFLGSR